MKHLISVLFLSLLCSISFANENYILEIDGKTFDIGIDKVKTININGDEHSVKLMQKAFIEYSSGLFSFTHDKDYQPNKTDLGQGIYQSAMMSALGTVIIVQEYTNINPSTLIDLMLQEVTREEVQIGYTYKEEPISQTIDGKTLNGKLAITSSKNEEWKRAVYAHGKDQEGILIMTMIEKENYNTETKIIDEFWKNFQIKF